TVPGVSPGFIRFHIADEDGNKRAGSGGWIPVTSNVMQTSSFDFPMKKKAIIRVDLVPMSFPDLTEDKFDTISLNGDYNALLPFKQGQRLIKFQVGVGLKKLVIVRQKDISFDQILNDLNISRFLVFAVSTENVHDANNETVAFRYTFQ